MILDRPAKMANPRWPAAHSRVTAACKQVARYIHRQGFGVGDKLPPQTELGRILGFCQNTIHPAMRLFVDMGMLSRRTHYGTEIISLEPLNRLTWTVGLAVMDLPIQGPGAFHAWLLHALQSELAKRQCTGHTYFRIAEPHWPYQRLEDFPGLTEDVENRAIDGLITFEELDDAGRAAFTRAGIPLLFCGVDACDVMPFATLGDYRDMVAAAAAALVGQGARRLALVTGGFIELDAPAFADIVRRAVGAHGGNGLATEVFSGGIGVAAGEEAARSLVERPAAQRPDALIILDDFTAAGMARALAAQGGYAPRFAVLAHKQFSQVWPLPVLRYEIDIAELAARAVKTLQEALLDPSLPPRQEWVRARLAVEPDEKPVPVPVERAAAVISGDGQQEAAGDHHL